LLKLHLNKRKQVFKLLMRIFLGVDGGNKDTCQVERTSCNKNLLNFLKFDNFL